MVGNHDLLGGHLNAMALSQNAEPKFNFQLLALSCLSKP